MDGLNLKYRIRLDAAYDLISRSFGEGDDGDLSAVFAQVGQGPFVQPFQRVFQGSRFARSRPGKQKETARLIKGQACADRVISVVETVCDE